MKKISDSLVRKIYNVLREHGPLTLDELLRILCQDGDIRADRDLAGTIRGALDGHTASWNWESWYDKAGPVFFESVLSTRTLKWKLVDLPDLDEDQTSADAAASEEIDRQEKLDEIGTRPGQRKFSAMIRQNYAGTCAVTGCQTPAALEAAHIRVYDGRDNNSPDNGILLRTDIHALFDALLITLAEDGRGLEIGAELVDPTYAFLRVVEVAAPSEGPASRSMPPT